MGRCHAPIWSRQQSYTAPGDISRKGQPPLGGQTKLGSARRRQGPSTTSRSKATRGRQRLTETRMSPSRILSPRRAKPARPGPPLPTATKSNAPPDPAATRATDSVGYADSRDRTRCARSSRRDPPARRRRHRSLRPRTNPFRDQVTNPHSPTMAISMSAIIDARARRRACARRRSSDRGALLAAPP